MLCECFFFAILSEIPFDLMVGRNIYYPKSQNVYVTLLLGFLLIWCYEHIRKEFPKAMAMGLLAVSAIALRGDYGLRGAAAAIVSSADPADCSGHCGLSAAVRWNGCVSGVPAHQSV